MPKLIRFLLFFCLLLCFVSLHAQSDSLQTASSYQDDEFNIFLFSLLGLFICGLFGAAFIGALAAALLFGFLFSCIAFGFFSVATAVAIYKRSFASGFNALTILIFGTGCSVIGVTGFLLIHSLFHLPASSTTLGLIGLLSGGLAGIIIGKLSTKILQHLLRKLLQKITTITS